MIESLLIKNVNIAFPDKTVSGDVFVKDGRIEKIAPSLSENAEVVIREEGLTLLPGSIDPHVHFRDPGATHKEDLSSGSRAAASGGVTSFFDMPNTSPSTTSLETLEEKKDSASRKSLINYNFFMGATTDNLDHCLRAKNVPGIKIYVGSSTGNLLVDETELLTQFFKQSPHLIAIHSEDETLICENKERYKESTNVHDHNRIRSVEGAIKCTQRCVALALKHHARLHICHLTTEEELNFLKETNRTDLITTEVTPQHLWAFAPEVYEKWGTFAQINPPIREKRHQQALLKGLLEGHIHCIGSDHAPHTKEEKQQSFGKAPSGMPGVETSLPLMLNAVNQGTFSLQQVISWCSEGPANLFNIHNKGMIKEGFDADLVLVDLKKKKTFEKSQIISKCGWSLFEGQSLTGWPIATFVNGQCVYREGDFFEEIKGKEIQLRNLKK
ncbi:dihydroorotase [Candidatus Marinamargulisbacteria bacterium SCGC AG-343-D04]|nr:dihydroorotase [Candidatus Marinamargulisbacteria bacterium SCGC AG-343-D04]